MNGHWPVSRLRQVISEHGTYDASAARAECCLDEHGETRTWRIWERGADRRWRPGPWRYPGSAQQKAAQ